VSGVTTKLSQLLKLARVDLIKCADKMKASNVKEFVAFYDMDRFTFYRGEGEPYGMWCAHFCNFTLFFMSTLMALLPYLAGSKWQDIFSFEREYHQGLISFLLSLR
jgi:hypothetical protein